MTHAPDARQDTHRYWIFAAGYQTVACEFCGYTKSGVLCVMDEKERQRKYVCRECWQERKNEVYVG